MTHTLREKEKLTLRVRRFRGQIDAIERALDQGKECAQGELGTGDRSG